MYATRKDACDEITAGVILKTSAPWLSGLLLATQGFSFSFTFFRALLWRSGDTWKESVVSSVWRLAGQTHGFRVLIRQCGSVSACVSVSLCLCVSLCLHAYGSVSVSHVALCLSAHGSVSESACSCVCLHTAVSMSHVIPCLCIDMLHCFRGVAPCN